MCSNLYIFIRFSVSGTGARDYEMLWACGREMLRRLFYFVDESEFVF